MPNVATGEDASGLMAQIATESAAAISDATVATPQKSESDLKTPENASEETPAEGEAPLDTPESTPETPAEEKSEEEVTPEEPKESENGAIKLGNREFATMQDATKEYNRVIGHNARIAGDLKARDTELNALKAEYQKAVAYNQEWLAYYQAQENGDTDTPMPAGEHKPDTKGMTPEEIAKITTETIERREKLAQFSAEIEMLEALPNYATVVDTIVSLSEKINPFTGTYFTPKEAYTAACQHHEVDNLLTKTSKPEKPRVMANPDAVKAASRPVPGSGGAPAPTDSKDSWSDHVDKQFDRLFVA